MLPLAFQAAPYFSWKVLEARMKSTSGELLNWNSTYAWAIRRVYTDIDGSTYTSLIGRYWWFGECPEIMPQHAGCPTALFKTRQAARDHLIFVRNGTTKASAIKVLLTVAEQ